MGNPFHILKYDYSQKLVRMVDNHLIFIFFDFISLFFSFGCVMRWWSYSLRLCESSPPSSCWPYTDEIYFKKSFFFFFILSLLPLTSNKRDKTVNLNELKQNNKRREKRRKKKTGSESKIHWPGTERKSVDPPQRDSGSIQTIKTMCVCVSVT